MGLHELSPAEGSRFPKKRKGRGQASGNGKTAGKGHKGQKARSGGKPPIGFEGGQMPLYRRLPKRGFGNGRFRKSYDVINVSDLAKLEAGTEVTLALLVEKGMIKNRPFTEGLKVLGNGELGVALNVKAVRFTKSATAKIEAAGGTAEVI